jgi:hypothetical protein
MLSDPETMLTNETKLILAKVVVRGVGFEPTKAFATGF